MEGIEAATSVTWESVEAPPAQAEVVDDDGASRPQLVIEREEPEDNFIPELPQQTVHEPDTPRVIEMPSGNPAATVADELRREMEAIRLSGPIPQDVPQSVSGAPDEEFDMPVASSDTAERFTGGAAQELIKELEALSKPAEPLEGRAFAADNEGTGEVANLTGFDSSAATAPEETQPPLVSSLLHRSIKARGPLRLRTRRVRALPWPTIMLVRPRWKNPSLPAQRYFIPKHIRAAFP